MNEKTLRILEYNKIIKKLADLAVSTLGKELAEGLFPEKDFKKIQSMLKETTDAVNFLSGRGNPPLVGISDIRPALKRVEIGAVLSPGELLKISDILRATRNLKKYSDESVIAASDYNEIYNLIISLEPNKKVEEKIKNAILSEDEISDNASASLGGIRKKIREMQDSVKDKLNEMIRSSKYGKFMQEAIVTMRGDRYVLPVRLEHRHEVKGLIHDASSSGATIFIEPMAVVEINNTIKQLKLREQVEIDRILKELTEDVESIIDILKLNISILARLDFVFAKAKFSIKNDCVCPKLSNKRRTSIKKGRHPLLDPKEVVPIDFWIGEDFETLVITGPNTGGKTVTLKTVGLFTLMTQAGLHVPAADGTEMMVFDKIFADIGDEQSIEQSLSTFSSHMKNIINILDEVDSQSLVLFDELGAGTDPVEGAGLAMAILNHLREIGAITVGTTHYSELKMYAIAEEWVENACCEFDVETLQPTYRLLIGVPGKSNAFAISKRLGLKNEIIENARELLNKEHLTFEDMVADIEKNLSETMKEKLLAENLRMQIEKLKNEAYEHERKTEEQKEKIIKEAKEEARQILLEAREESSEIIKNLRILEKEKSESNRNKEMEKLRFQIKNKIDVLDKDLTEHFIQKNTVTKPPRNLKPGDSVFIVNLNQKGTIINPPNKEGEAIVQVGIMKLNAHITNLKLVEEKTVQNTSKSGQGRISIEKSKNIRTEIMLRGMTLDDAMEELDKYLDDAFLAGINEVSIIHGKGTGVLRSGIHKHLKNHPMVKEFRLGRFGEGEAGVTIATLKY